MSDVNSSLPIRTENNGDAVVRLADGTVTSQLLAVNANGSLNVEQASAASLNATVVATDLDIRDLTSASDSVEVLQATPANLKAEVSQPTAANLNATVVATDLDIRDLSAAQDSVKISDGTDSLEVNADGSINITDNGGSLTVDATDLDIRDLVFATDKVDASGSAVTVTNTVAVSATDLDIRDLTAATDNVAAWIKDATGAAFSATNPLPVSISSDNPGTEINDYASNGAVAGGATANHDYTVTALKTLLLSQIQATASGKAKIEVQVESGVATGVFATKFVQFNSTANPNMGIMLKSPITVAAGVRVRLHLTNKEATAQDLYSTISGQEV